MKNGINQIEVCKALVVEMMVKQMTKVKKLEPHRGWWRRKADGAAGDLWSVGRDGDHHAEAEGHCGAGKTEGRYNSWWNQGTHICQAEPTEEEELSWP